VGAKLSLIGGRNMPNELYMDMRTHRVVRIVRKLNSTTYEVRIFNSNDRYIVEKENLRPVEFYHKKSEKDVA
jgi:hypothetical protein